jgi:hypothetical protein
MTLDKVQLLDDSGVTPGSYNLSSITVGADGRLTAASTPGSISLPGTGVSDGDISSAGGTDGVFNISNTTTGGRTSFNVKNPSTGASGDLFVVDPTIGAPSGFPYSTGTSPVGTVWGSAYVKGSLLLGDTTPGGEIGSSGGNDGNFGIFNYAETPGDPATTDSRRISFYTKNISTNAIEGRFVINQYGCTSVSSLGYLGQLISEGGGLLGSSDVVADGGTDGVWVHNNTSMQPTRQITFTLKDDSATLQTFFRIARDPSNGDWLIDAPYQGINFSVNGTKNFRISHPIDDTKNLVHVSIEGPRADLIYRGTVQLVDGEATVNLDEEYGLIPGTWAALCRNAQVWVTSLDGWEPCRGSVEGEILTIRSKDITSGDTVSWLVVSERKDAAMYKGANDENGRPILEPTKIAEPEPHPLPPIIPS